MENLIIYSTSVINVSSAFSLFLSYLYLFIIGSFLGWVLEVFFRRFFSMKRWTNPGFLKGPCLPLYGFGLCLLFTICYLALQLICNGEGIPAYLNSDEGYAFSGSLNFMWTSLIVIALIGVGMTLLEYIAGIIFVKGFNIKLWDYSTLKGNIQGIICPLFSVIWLLVGAIYWFLVHPFINRCLEFFSSHIWGITFILGAYFALLIVDFIQSCKLAGKLSGVAKKNKFVVDLSKYQLNIHLDKIKKNKDAQWFAEQAELAASKLKTKFGELTYDIKRHMYVNNEIPTVGAATTDETPRTKAERIKKEKSSKD
jgi:uncharacterized membrane protein